PSCTCLAPSYLCFFNYPPTTALSTLSLHDALPISWCARHVSTVSRSNCVLSPHQFLNVDLNPWTLTLMPMFRRNSIIDLRDKGRSEEHTSELQSLTNLVCRLLLEKKTKHPPQVWRP